MVHGLETIKKMNDEASASPPQEERMLKWFKFDHLPEHLKEVSFHFSEMAHRIVFLCEPGPERTVALRCLLESKDAAVRSKVHPGG